MFKRSIFALALLAAIAPAASAQNTNTGTTPPSRRARSAQAKPTPAPASSPSEVQTITAAPPRAGLSAMRAAPRTSLAERAVRDIFDTLVDGIRRADVETVMGTYWNSPQLTLFNNNGTITKSWQQVRANRQTSYPNLKDVKLDVRDVRVHVLSPDSAVVACLWTQTQNVRDAEETASGRLTLVLQRTGGVWKIVHAHTSPDRPDPSLIPPSERTTEPPAADPATKPPVRP